jgi:putative glutamine amidotransferase
VKVIAVSQRIEYFPERGEHRDVLDQRLVALLAICDTLVVPVPNILADTGQLDAWLMKVQPQAIVLSGGNDLGEYLERDRTEEFLLNRAKEAEMPVLGVCRGMQMLGVFAGSTLKIVDGHAGTRHRVNGVIQAEVNSFHNYALAEVPDHYTVLARSGDDVIEAIRHTRLPWEGWMWHPEREPEFATRDINRIKALLA